MRSINWPQRKKTFQYSPMSSSPICWIFLRNKCFLFEKILTMPSFFLVFLGWSHYFISFWETISYISKEWINNLRFPFQWRHNGLDSVSNHQPRHCLLSRLFERRSKKTSKLRVTGLCVRNSPGTGEFPAQMASYAENVSIWWRHHV